MMMKTTEYLFLGNLMPGKGVLVLLDACVVLRKSVPHFKCHFVGAASPDMEPEELRECVRNCNLQDCVLVHGPLYGEKKEEMFRRADVFVFPTYIDCFPLVVVEAMKHGLPVISTEEGAIPDMVIHGETGLLVEKRNSKALAAAMQQLASNPEWAAQMGRKGRSLYEASFTQSAFEQRVCDILHRA